MSDRYHWLCAVIMSQTSIATVKVATVLSECCNGTTGQCNPSQNYIAETCGLLRANVPRALRTLRDAGFIQSEKTEGMTRQYNLILEGEDVSPVMQDEPPEPPKVASHDATNLHQQRRTDSLYSVVNRFKKEEPLETQSPTLDSDDIFLKPGDWKEGAFWPDLEGQKVFKNFTGLTTKKEFRIEVLKFIAHNEKQKRQPSSYQRMWLNWVSQIVTFQADKKRERIVGDVTGTSKAPAEKTKDAVKSIVAPKGRCWEKFSNYIDPYDDKGTFIRMGCNRLGACTCTPEQRKAHIEELKKCPPLPKPARR